MQAGVIKVGTWGGNRRSHWDMGPASRITKVQIHSGLIVDSIKVWYVVDGKSYATSRHGGPAATPTRHPCSLSLSLSLSLQKIENTSIVSQAMSKISVELHAYPDSPLPLIWGRSMVHSDTVAGSVSPSPLPRVGSSASLEMQRSILMRSGST
ncbi:unnamed protein product [Musa textilis]